WLCSALYMFSSFSCLVPFLSSTAPSPTSIYTLSLHDALPICAALASSALMICGPAPSTFAGSFAVLSLSATSLGTTGLPIGILRSEEHTSELQSRFDLVCRLLLAKKKYNSSSNKISDSYLL